ncbi:CoA transferase [Nocardia transvalensis]|uniref:CoA transferase n=1 Tax=Nocardia transvalensis TaxID=37333 RepID=UPI001894CFFC|nr:CoA transferase [Nocardia transvalensis]MBF6332828.1 CoA transferase [Nocardia transvalensis]
MPVDAAFDPLVALNDLLAPIGLDSADAGGAVDFAGRDPILESRLRLGAAIGIPMMAGAVGVAALWRHRGGHGQDLHLDLRQAVYYIAPEILWEPTVNGFPAPAPLVEGNPFLLDIYRTRDGREVVPSAVYPHLMRKWCVFLDVPPARDRVAAAIAEWDSDTLEEQANKAGLPIATARTPQEWLAHPQGALLADGPVIALHKVGEAAPLALGDSDRPLGGIRALSFTHAIAGPTVGRTLAEQGADVLCGTRPDDFEHDFIYDAANIGSRSAYLDLTTADGRDRTEDLLDTAHIVIDNHRRGKLERFGLDPHALAARHPGLISVAVTPYGSQGPWRNYGGFDMNASAATGLMAIEGEPGHVRFPVTSLINDFITGYLGAAGAVAALVKRVTEGGSWRVEVSLARAAMWYPTLGLVDATAAGSSDDTTAREPTPYDAPTPLGALHTPRPAVEFSATPPRWPDPPLVPRGSSAPRWRADARRRR